MKKAYLPMRKITIKSFIFLAYIILYYIILYYIILYYIILAFPYKIHSSTHILNYEQEMKKIKVVTKKIMKCESPDGKHTHWGDLNYKYKAYGVLQFQQRTFIWLSNLSGKKNLKWKNKKHQIQLFEWA